jgi:glycosyltransferase involved in cell wall biosynthesis
MKILSLLINLVPYHVARWSAVAGETGVDLVVVQARKEDEFRILETKVEGYCFKLETLGLDPDQPSVKRMRSCAADLMERHQPDVIVTCGYSFPVSLAFIEAAGKRRIPVIVCSESNQFDCRRNPILEWIKGQVVGLCQAGMVGGEPQRRYLAELGIPDERIFKGYNAVENNHFKTGAEIAKKDQDKWRHQYGLPENYFFAVSRFTEKKNIPALIDAYAAFRLRRPESKSHLLIAGDGSCRTQIEARIAHHELKDWIFLKGAISYDDLPAHYGLAKAFILASHTEQWGLVVNEAMAAGTPVLVSSRCGCAQDLVIGGETGKCFDPSFPDEWISALGWADQLISEEREKIGRQAQTHIESWSPANFSTNLIQAAHSAKKAPPSGFNLWHRLLLGLLMIRGEKS